MNFNKPVFIRSFLLVLFTMSFAAGSVAQEIIYLQASNDYNGQSLDVEFRVESSKSKKSYTIKNEGNLKYVEIPRMESLTIKAFKDGYYVEKKEYSEDELISNNYEVKVSMQQRPTARLIISAISSENNRKVPASFDVFYLGKMIGRGNTTRNVESYELPVEQDGMYVIQTKSDGFDDLQKQIQVSVGIPENRVSAEIFLEKEANEVALKIIDEQTGRPVPSTVTILNTQTGDSYFSEFSGNGTVLFAFKSGINYKIIVDAENYKKLEKSISGRQIEDLTLRLKQNTFVDFQVVDRATQRKIDAEIEITSPSGKKEVLKEDTFFPQENGNYKIVAHSPGYLENSGTVMVNSLAGGKMDFKIELTEADKQYYVKVIDHYSKQELRDVEFRVFGPKGEQLRGIKQNEDGEWVFITDPTKEYFIEANLETYQDFTKMLKEDEKKFTIELFWAIPFTHTIKLLDKYDGEVVNSAALKVVDKNGNDLFVFHDVRNQAFKVKYEKSMAVSYSIVANGYKDDIAGINTKPGNNVEIILERADNERVTFFAVDYVTDKPIEAVYRYFRDDKLVDLSKNLKAGEATGDLNDAGKYRLEARLDNYRPFNGEISKAGVVNGRYKIRLKRDTYKVKFDIENFNTPQELSDLTFRILTEGRVRIPETFTAATGMYEANLDADTDYILELIKDGYAQFSEGFNIKELVSSNFVKSINLEKLPEPEPVAIKTPKPEPTPPKPEPKVSYETPAEEMPETAQAMAKEFTAKESIGKRYLLDEVYFDQSSAAIRKDEIPQLNELAKTLAENKSLVIKIVGYTDNVGDARLNLGLSKFRAKAVSNYLFYQGADPDRILSDGFGKDKPVASNDSEEDRSKNRRVEMVLLEN
ncbi:OmpA family protein [Jiulongibacter sediminis]|uniref:OmpA family protein n=1 Tax=Jiulongibacter sediminis TaxID=1605367 RepID=UPI0026EC8042|nr:OmpA family protein [Jiulongibacter sediminis]